MKNLFLSFSILLFISMCLWAQNVPQTIDYQGRLADSDGNYLNGVVTVDFLIYNVETGGTTLWSEPQDVSMSNGIFHVLLGSITPLPSTLFDNADRWLELIVGGETLSPRTQIASVPFSIKAETAYSVEVPLNLTGNVSSPNSVIKGENTGSGLGVYGIHSSSGNDGYLGWFDCGAFGRNYSDGGFGVYGYNTGSNGYGVYGYNTGSNGYGVYGNSSSGWAGYFDGKMHISDMVGIGTINPGRMLTVNSTGANPIQWQVNSLILGQLGTNGSGAGGLYLYDNGPISTVITANGYSYFNGGNVGIGTDTPDTKLHIEGSIKIVDGSQGANKVLTSDANGTASWQTLSAGGDITAVTAGTGLTGGGTSGDVTLNVDVPLNLSGNVSFPNSVIKGENTGTGYGVYGIHDSSGNFGGLGWSIYGVFGRNNSGNYGYLGSSDYGIYGKHFSSNNYGYLGSSDYGVYGEHESSGNYGYLGSSDYGVSGYNTALNGYGVYGSSTGHYGGYFTSNYNSYYTHVVHAEFTGTSYDAIAVYGKSRPADNLGIGGWFEGGYLGVYGRVNPTGSDAYRGVFGYVSGGSGTNYGIRGYAIGGSTNYAGYFQGNVHYTGTLTGPSDERFKENVQPFKNALSKIKLMNVHTFNFIQMEEKQLVLPEGKQIGLIAQELEEILPELVKDEVHAYNKNEGIEGAESNVEKIEYKGINYIGLIPVLIEAMQEQQQQIEELKQQIAELK